MSLYDKQALFKKPSGWHLVTRASPSGLVYTYNKCGNVNTGEEPQG